MQITSVEWKELQIPLKKPFKIALGTIENYHGVIVKICTEEHCGFGEASPSPRITGDTVGSTIAALNRFKPILLGSDALEIGAIMRELEKSAAYNTTAKAAIDMALYDLLGKHANMPVRNILGGEKEKIETSLTVSIGSVNEMLKSAESLINSGAKVLKVKIGLSPDEDILKIRELRNITDIKIRVDANQGYSLKRAIKVLRALERYEIEFAEQPLPAEVVEDLAVLRSAVDIPIMADESVHRSIDVLKILGKVDAINIKLMKSGGIYEALKMAAIAKAAGIKVMVGCMIETKLGITAGTQFALGIGADYADLDGYWDLGEQPFTGVEFKDGYNVVSSLSGVGASPSD